MKRPECLLSFLAFLSAAVAQQPQSQLPPNHIFTERLRSIGGAEAVDCGTTRSFKPDDSIAACGLKAFQEHKPFLLGYYTQYGDNLAFAYGLAGDTSGSIFAINYDSRLFPPPVAPTPRTRLMDANHTRITECVNPVRLDRTSGGLLACITPVNQEESDKAAHQPPVNTTVCAVLENPAAFNNRLVRLRGHFSGNFEYSMLSGDGCQESLWFEYAGGDGPPSLTIWVGGGARPGSEDSQGRFILPVTVKLVRDSKLKLFERQTVAMAKADSAYEKKHPEKYVSHCVTATFVGRIDGVSTEVHEFRKKQKNHDHSDGLGFGQMGQFEAQLVLESVTDDATLGVCD